MPRPVEPRPLKQHRLKTIFLRVPTPVWSQVSTGRISEFRAASGNAPQLWNVPLPTLAVVFRRRRSDLDYRVMTLVNIRREALGTITPEGLAAAGYGGEDAFARFRREWTIHEKKRFEPLRTVFVYTVHPVQPGDAEAAGVALINHLYGDYAKEAQTRPRTVPTERRSAESASSDRAQLEARGRHAA